MKEDHVNMEEDFKNTKNENDDRGDEIEVEYKDSSSDTETADVVPEEAEVSEEETAEPVSEVERLERELAELKDKYLRLAAEFDNYKKRTARDFSTLVETANQDLIKSLLDILDNFRRALATSRDSDAASIFKGMELIYSQLDNLLKDRGLEEIDALGKPFDPELHDAVMTMQTDEYPEDHVADEFQKGYKLKGRIIRHSKVAVAKPKGGN
jgi:molecular chaperone GrpE